MKEGGRKTVRARERDIFYEIVSPRKVRNYSHEGSPTWLPKHDLSNGLANTDRRKLRRPQPQAKNNRQLQNAEIRRNSLPQGRGHQLVTQYQMVSPKKYIHTSDSIKIEWVISIFSDTYTYTHTHRDNHRD